MKRIYFEDSWNEDEELIPVRKKNRQKNELKRIKRRDNKSGDESGSATD